MSTGARVHASHEPISFLGMTSAIDAPRIVLCAGAEMDLDVIVVGAGHAGTEAAVAAARLGARVAIVTSALETIGQMSCNPAIGGVAKGTVVREVDALGGIMGARDRSGDAPVPDAQPEQGSGGVGAARAVRSRAVSPRRAHAARGAPDAPHDPGHGRATAHRHGRARALGVETLEGRRFAARAVVITAGTFLRGRIHIGTETKLAGGRAGEAPAMHLAQQLEELGLEVARFKTGTPPRIDGRSVDLSRLQRQDSEVEAFDFSWSHFWSAPRRTASATRHPDQLPCWITYAGDRSEADHR